MPHPPPAPQSPLWLPLHAVARPVLGLSAELMESAIAAGQLPIRAAKFGRRGLTHVNAADLTAYVQQQRNPR